jgi:hypothetical protein
MHFYRILCPSIFELKFDDQVYQMPLINSMKSKLLFSRHQYINILAIRSGQLNLIELIWRIFGSSGAQFSLFNEIIQHFGTFHVRMQKATTNQFK